MVKSKLNSNVNYTEIKILNSEDRDKEVALFEIELFDIPLLIALGEEKYNFVSENLVYFPVYIIKNEKVGKQIGIYELFKDDLTKSLDEDGDVDISKLDGPLLYSFVNKEYLSGFNRMNDDENPDEEDSEGSEEEDGEEEDGEEKDGEEEDGEEEDGEEEVVSKIVDKETKDTDEGYLKLNLKEELPEQNSAIAKKESDEYVETTTDSWIQKYLKNSNYSIVNNEGGGDCLFSSIRDGLKLVNVERSVADMRKILADETTEETFQTYKEMYDFSNLEKATLNEDIKKLASEFKTLKKGIETETERTKQRKIISQADKISKEHKELLTKRNEVNNMANEFAFMKGINTIEAFRAKIQTSEYWGDTWAISTLERVMKIKLILFAKEYYATDNEDNILTCGQLNDTKLEEAGIFEPTYYIILNYLGNHYELITYKNHGALTFKELPYDIKKRIVDKCIERAAGPFYIIPDFKKLMTKMNVVINEEEDNKPELYDDTTVFQFYYKSSNIPKPGKGSGEKLGSEGAQEYVELAAIKNWRRKLSNLWEQEFTIDNKKWLTVEHYYQASKYRIGNPEHYALFSLESGSELSKNPKLARVTGTNKKKQVDENFFNGRHETEMKTAMKAKFSQNDDLNKLLKNTKRAKLQMYVKGSQPVVYDSLMEIRKEL